MCRTLFFSERENVKSSTYRGKDNVPLCDIVFDRDVHDAFRRLHCEFLQFLDMSSRARKRSPAMLKPFANAETQTFS